MKNLVFFALLGATSLAITGISNFNVYARGVTTTTPKTTVLSYTGTLSSVSLAKDAFKLTTGNQTVEILLGKSFLLNTRTLLVGDVVTASGTMITAQFSGDIQTVKAKSLIDNGIPLNLNPASQLTTYTAAAVTAVSLQHDAIRITVNSKIVEVHLGKIFFASHPLAIGDKITIQGKEVPGIFIDSPTALHATSITINGSTYGHMGK